MWTILATFVVSALAIAHVLMALGGIGDDPSPEIEQYWRGPGLFG